MKIFRCPVHDVIDLSTGDEQIDKLIIELIDSKEFQRLKKVKQLGFASFSYPSAEHSRFPHSLGVAFIAKEFINKIISLKKQTMKFFEESDLKEKYLHKVEDFFIELEKDKPLTIVAALLHDIGHGAFSHATEKITGIDHEKWVRSVILGDTEINLALCKYDARYPSKICDILSNSKIISGKIDIDKMDYLLRDSVITGAKYGKYDIKWLYECLLVGIHEEEVTIGLDEGKGLGVSEQFILARYYMFKYVYNHKTSLVAQKMLEKLIERLQELYKQDKDKYVSNNSLNSILFLCSSKNYENYLKNYLEIKDSTYEDLFESLLNSDDEILRALSLGLSSRKLFKSVDKDEYFNLKNMYEAKKGKHIAKYHFFHIVIDSYNSGLAYRTNENEVILFNKKGISSELSRKSSVVLSLVQSTTEEIGYFVSADVLKLR